MSKAAAAAASLSATPIAERPPVVNVAGSEHAKKFQTKESKNRQEKILQTFLAAKKTTGGRRTRRRGARKSRRGKGKGKSRRRRRSKKCKCSLL